MSTTNPNWVTPKHGELCGVGMAFNSRFVDIYDADVGRMRRYWNHDTAEDDAHEAKRAEGKRLAFKNGEFQSENEHGVNCPKILHTRTGYLHDENDDRAYDVDGVKYCGRCHSAL